MDPGLDYTREASSRYQQVCHPVILSIFLFIYFLWLQVLVQDPYRKLNAARAVTSAKHWKTIQTELKHSVQKILTQPDIGFDQLCEKGAGEADPWFVGLTLGQAIARLRM